MSSRLPKKTRVYVNLTRLVQHSKGAGGAGWFALEVCLSLQNKYDAFAVTGPSIHTYVLEALTSKGFPSAKVVSVHEPLPAFLERRAAEIDVWLDPLNGLEPQQIPGSIQSVATLHDFMFLREPQVFDQHEINGRINHYFSAVDRADLVITVAEREKQTIQELYPNKEVHVVDQYAYFQAQAQKPARTTDSKTVLFSPGVHWNHKNHLRLAIAFLELLEAGRIGKDVILCFSDIRPVEAGHELVEEALSVSKFANNIVFLPFLTKAQLSAFHDTCSGYVLPSIHEGYGIPLVEAVANGIPVLSGRFPSADSLKETPDFVHFIDDLHDTAEIADKLENFINNLPKADPRPDLCPTQADFTAALDAAIDRAMELRSEHTPAFEAKLPILNKRRDAVVAFAMGEGSVKTNAESFDEVVVFGPRTAATGSHVRGALGSNAEILAIAFAHEILLCRQRYVLVCDTADLPRVDAERLGRSLRRLNRHTGGHVKLSCLIDDGDIVREHRNAIPYGLFDLDAFDFPFDTRTQSLLQSLANARALVGAHLPRAIITDPSLKTEKGHHLGVARDLALGLSDAGYYVVGVINRDAEIRRIPGAAELIKQLSDFIYEDNGDVGQYEWEFRHAMQAANVCGGDLIFSHCATAAMLAGMIIWLTEQPADERPHIVIRFDRPDWRMPFSLVTYERCFELIKTLGLRENFHFSVESKNLQKHFRRLSGENFPIRFNSSFRRKSDHLDRIGIHQSEDKGNIVVSFVGEAREEKGFQHLPFIIDFIFSNLKDQPIKFHVQLGSNSWNDTPQIQAARARLEQISEKNPGRLKMLRGTLSDVEYSTLLSDSDIILMPYDPVAYRTRGSGVASEGAALGKVIVVSYGCDVIDTYADHSIVASEAYSPLDISLALQKAIGALPRLAERAKLSAKSEAFPIKRQAFASNFLTQVPSPNRQSKTRLVLWIANDTYGEGSDRVYQSQLGFLRDRGYLPVCIRVPYPARWRVGQSRLFDWTEFFDEFSMEAGFSDDPRFEAVLRKFEAGVHSMENFGEAWSFLQLPPALKRFLQRAEFAFAVVNYAHHRPVVDQLLGRKVPAVVEAHDIQAYQYAIQQNRLVDDNEVRDELEALADFDHIVSISASEAKEIGKVSGEDKLTWCMPFVEAHAPELADTWDVDVLFVGSSHEANLISLHWFMQAVYEAILYPQGVTLRVVGSAGSTVDRHRYGGIVEVTGRVEDLAPHYAACGVVALPVIAGAGVPIKVIDTFSRGAPFALMDYPAAAMNLSSDIPLARDAEEMAKQILSCLADRHERRKRAAAGFEFARKFASRENYYAKWDEILRNIKN